jgi:hypothetical protein
MAPVCIVVDGMPTQAWGMAPGTCWQSMRGTCHRCGKSDGFTTYPSGDSVPCPYCRTAIQVAAPGDGPFRENDGRIPNRGVVYQQHHSWLGALSFAIAALAGGTAILAASFLALMIDEAHRHPNRVNEGAGWAGLLAFMCMPFMNVPACIVGIGLGLWGMARHPDCKHTFTWLGICGNLLVIIGILGMFILTVLLNR